MRPDTAILFDNEEPSTDRVNDLVSAGRLRFNTVFEGTGQKFEDAVWDLDHLLRRVVKNQSCRLYFSDHTDSKTLLPPYFVNIIKSWLLLDSTSPEYTRSRLDIAKWLWEAIRVRLAGNLESFRWENLCEEDLMQVETLISKEWHWTTCKSGCTRLRQLVNFLINRGVCRSLYYVPGSTGVRRKDRYYTFEEQNERRASKLPSKRALDGLGDIYATLAKAPPDRLRIVAVALLVVTGFRIGELLTLPENCEVEETREGRTIYGLLYHKEKTKGHTSRQEIRWLTPLQAQLARRVIAEIREITAKARVQARQLERNPNRVEIPRSAYSGPHMTIKEVSNILGCKPSNVNALVKQKRLKRLADSLEVWTFSVADVKKYLFSRRVKRLWTIDLDNGKHQMLSESLFIAPRNFFDGRTGITWLLIEPVSERHITDFLSNKSRSYSAFERFNIKEADGTYCHVTTHQFRHWLNDTADKGGLPIETLNRWMGRENPFDAEAYRHATVDERLQWVKAGIKTEDITGTMADVYFELPEEERDLFLEGQIQAVHFTPMGLCIHDFAIEPCPYHLNCVRGCPHYLRTKGSQKERANLIQIQENTKKALESARYYYAVNADKDISQTWLQHHEETLKGIRNALAVDDDLNIGEGDMVKPVSIPLNVLNVGSK